MTTKQPGPRRVEAWIYGVINPLEEALEREALEGRRRSPSFRWRTRSLEALVPLRRYLSRAAGIIFDDLASYHAEIEELEQRHDAMVSEIREQASRLFDALISDQAFVEYVSQHFGKVCSPETMVNDVAEDVVNDDPEYVDVNEGSYREQWNRSLDTLKQFRDRAGYDPLRSALMKLETEAEQMRAALLGLRKNLADEFDIPPAPVHA